MMIRRELYRGVGYGSKGKEKRKTGGGKQNGMREKQGQKLFTRT
jgi:hypothetical protein